MAAVRKWAEPARPLAFRAKAFADAWWDEDKGVWRDGPSGEYWYDEATANKAVGFFPKYVRLVKGEWAGRPFVLEPWQEHDIVRPIFGWKRGDGTRRFRRCFIWVARKNGKTELAAGIALLMLLGDAEQGGEVYSIASEEAQAKIVFNKATRMIAYSGPLSDLLEPLQHSIYCPQLDAAFRALSGKATGKHGLNMSGLVGDEVHEWKSGDLYTFIHDSAAARRQPLEVMISTAGVRGTHGEEIWNECQSVLTGEIEDPETLVVAYAADPEDDWTQEETWRKANPNWGLSVKVASFMADFHRARQSPRLENDFKRYRLNMWTEQAVRWLPIDQLNDEGVPYGWKYCAGPVGWKDLEDRLAGMRCFGGLDMSATQDLSSEVLWFPVQEGLEVPALLARFWKPAALIKEHTKRDKIPYDRFVEQEALFTTPGNVIDPVAIRAQVMKDAAKFRFAFYGVKRNEREEGGLAIDRAFAVETIVQLFGEGLPVVPFGQGFWSMSSPSKEAERLVLTNGFHHGNHPVLYKHAQAVAVETDAAGNIKPSKDKSTLRIDGIVAWIMALGIAARDRPAEPPKPSIHFL